MAGLNITKEKNNGTSGSTKTFWLENEELPRFETLSRNLTCDVVVVGAGIAGLSTAYNALKMGLSVIVLEDGQVCSEEVDD
jgi:NADPH-dependent 2,4-dienoyl-CoA reductase/sulfur reductase-like enzyme